QGQHQQREQGAVVDRRLAERLVQRGGAQITDHRAPLLRHLRARASRLRAVVRHPGGFATPADLRGLLRLRNAVDDRSYFAGVRIEVVTDQVVLAGLAVDVFGFLRQLRAAI